jgi:acetyl-CoA/propionyl-CoA carboxylase biotin carboxyl carrier protein
VRVDAGVREGSVVGTDFDPMLAKVIAYGADRAEALRRLDRALSDLEVLGVTTNAAFSRALLALPEVVAGDLDTGLLERVLDELDHAPPGDLLVAAALAAAGTAHPAGPWRRAFDQGAVRIAGGTVEAPDGTHTARVLRCDDGVLLAEIDGLTRSYRFALDGEDAVWIARDGLHLAAATKRADHSGAGLPAGSLEAPMPGTVLQVRVADGDEVAEGDVLLVLESMKMELAITAPYAGTVEGLALQPGDKVTLRQPLVAVVR